MNYHTFNFNKIILTLAICLMGFVVSAQEIPKFSNGETEYWYYIEFNVNSTVIQDTGLNQELRNRNPLEGELGQLWKFSGSDAACTLTCKTGRKLYYDRTNNRFKAANSESTQMKLVETSTGRWELHLADASLAPSSNPDAVAIVINNAEGVDRYLDVWKHDFAACALNFIPESDMIFTVQSAPTDINEVAVSGSSIAPEEPLSLWYSKPASDWVKEALPIGNGDMGAMIFGGIAMDRIQFNHKTLWKGSSGATDLGSYLAFGDLYVINKNATKVSDYRRDLNLTNAVVNVEYTANGTAYEREYFCSYPDKVIAVKYSVVGDEPLSVDLQFINAQGNRAEYTVNGATFQGTLSNGMNYRAAMSVEQKGGSVTADNKAISIDGAEELVIYITCTTDFDASQTNHLHGNADALANELNNIITAVGQKGFDAVKADHIADYSELFSRVDFTLTGAKNNSPTNRLLQRSSLSATNMVDMLIFHYGRYLTISSSRGISVPSNLQGIWNKDGNSNSDAVWASDIHSNINVQMNYWPVEPTNLSECHMPFLNYIKNEALRTDGRWQQNARDVGVNKGWLVNTAGNIFGGSSSYKIGKYSVVNAWYCTHLWQHFAYTQDVDFLRNSAMPIMKSACEFWFDRLVTADNNDGTLECPNEYSPEQGYVQNATAHSQQLVTMLFEQTLQAIDILGNDDAQVDDAFVNTLNEKLSKLDKGLRIDDSGMLREWKYQENTPNIGADQNYFANDEQNVWQCHRHTSHLMALYPGFGIDKGIDKDIFNAAVKSLDDRGDVGTGWARAWRIALWARVRDSERTYTTLRGFAHRTTALTYDWHGGLYDNMLDAHATSVFQIEGNFGATAGIAEMLMQSRPDSLILLPTIPKEWAGGSVKGLKAIGNFEVDMEWENSKLLRASIHSHAGQILTIAYPGIKSATLQSSSGNIPEVTYINDNTARIMTEKDNTYLFDFPTSESNISEIDSNVPRIKVENRRIKLLGNYSDIAVYDTKGCELDANEPVSPGVYLVKSGGYTQPIFVK